MERLRQQHLRLEVVPRPIQPALEVVHQEPLHLEDVEGVTRLPEEYLEPLEQQVVLLPDFVPPASSTSVSEGWGGRGERTEGHGGVG